MRQTNFVEEIGIYAGRVTEFNKEDWRVYTAWVGLMMGLCFSVAFFLGMGWKAGVEYPVYVWNIPIGTLIFSAAISFDTIGHRTVYKAYLQKVEALVHHITIFAGISSVVMLCLAYHWPVFMKIPTLVFVVLSIFYSVIDEALHWHRYFTQNSDRVEMTSHFFIFVGHLIMIIAWWQWYAEGYPGVPETIQALGW